MPNANVVEILRVENIELYRGYCHKKASLERSRQQINERFLWHGTKTLDPKVIAKEGFDFRVANAGSLGRVSVVNLLYLLLYQFNILLL